MGQLPSTKSLGVEDFPEQKDWIEKLLTPLNSFMSVVFTNLNKGLTFSDNINAFMSTVTVLGGNFPVNIKNLMKTKPVGVLLSNIYQKTDPRATIGTAMAIEWDTDTSNIRIKNITGLTANVKYVVTFLILGG